MDRASSFNVMSLFSRGASPPPNGQDTNSPPPPQPSSSSQYQPQAQQNPPASQSYRENQPSSSPPTKVLDSLFRNIGPQPSQSSEPAALVGGNNPFRAQPPPQNNSAPTTPVSSTTVASAQSSAPANVQPADRQSALLSLLGSVASPAGSVSSNSANQPSTNQPPQLPQQPPTPPIGDQRNRAMPGANEAQGKILLEQLMSGNNTGSSYGESPAQNAYTVPMGGPYQGRIYGPMLPGADSYQGSYISQDTPRENVPQPASVPQQPSQSMFDYITPFDALAAPATSKKKTDVGFPSTEHRDSDDSWASVPATMDPKRKSVENLMDQLARSQGPLQATQQPPDLYNAEPGTPPTELAQLASKVPLPLSASALQGQGSPRASPPFAQRPQQVRSGDSPLLSSASLKPNQASAGPSIKERAGSPLAKGSWKAQDSKQRAPAPRRPLVSPSTPAQNIVFDVAQNLDSIQASRDCVRSTAIALVKVESTFLPGTTIGATHWVAYAMTRGRVRVISRSSGDRTLLQLPSAFGNTVSVTDMAVHGNRLAGVTSDGGFVVWELPELITDDVPGRLLVYIVPSSDADPLHAVKWHPRDPDTLAVASESNLYLLNVTDCANVYGGEPISQADLSRVARVFPIPTPLASFDFDIPHQAVATITEDSVLTVWSIVDKYPLWQSKIPGDGTPSSLNFVDAGVVIGRKNGTNFQLLPALSDVVLSNVKFTNAGRDDPDMFGHITYDSRIQTLWVANSRRDSLIAFRVTFDMVAPVPGEDEVLRGAYIDQVVEFVGPKPTIHFVILTADADPTGDEANAACIAAKLPPGDLALVAFSVHSSGVDQVLIKKEWYDSAFATATTKYPPYTPPQVNTQAPRQPPVSAAPQTLSQPIPSVPVRLRTPPSEEVEIEHVKEDTRDVKGKGAKGKNVGWKDRDDSGKDKGKGPAGDSSPLTDSALGVTLQKEIRKVEENLHTRIGRLIAKELDKQHQRLEEARANEQAADFLRQEKILKLISTELTKNTTRVVETAVKGEVQNSVLPSLENITKTEVKAAMNNQILKGLGDSVKNTLPPEIEKMLLKPEITNQIARNLSNHLSPFIERYVKESVSKTLVPAYQAQTTVMHQELTREIHNEMMGLKKDVMSWQTEALRSQETMIRDMEQSIRTLSEQIKFLTLNTATLPQSSSSSTMATRSSPGPVTSSYGPSPMYRGAAMPSMGSQHGNFPTTFQPPPPPLHSQWHQSIPTTHTTPPVVASPQTQQAAQQPPARSDEWDDTYLAVLGSQDLKQLRELLARSNPEVIMPTNGPGPLSQAVVLTLVHRLAGAIGETSPVDEAFKSSLWWLQRAATTLNTNDPLISPYTARVLPNVQQMLNTTKQRLAILPGGPQLIDTTRMISDIQDTLSRKPM